VLDFVGVRERAGREEALFRGALLVVEGALPDTDVNWVVYRKLALKQVHLGPWCITIHNVGTIMNDTREGGNTYVHQRIDDSIRLISAY